jgi:hypothetical protein
MISIQYYNEWQENLCDVEQNEKDDSLGNMTEQHIVASIGLAKVSYLTSNHNFSDFRLVFKYSPFPGCPLGNMVVEKNLTYNKASQG